MNKLIKFLWAIALFGLISVYITGCAHAADSPLAPCTLKCYGDRKDTTIITFPLDIQLIDGRHLHYDTYMQLHNYCRQLEARIRELELELSGIKKDPVNKYR